jgi:transcriptional regulator with XRE-family HTH domain
METIAKTTVPIELRRLRAKMNLKGLSLKEVSRLSGVGYTYCSNILAGRFNDATRLMAIKRAIRNAPMPELEAA